MYKFFHHISSDGTKMLLSILVLQEIAEKINLLFVSIICDPCRKCVCMIKNVKRNKICMEYLDFLIIWAVSEKKKDSQK